MTRKPRCAVRVRFDKETESGEAPAVRRWPRRAALGGLVLVLSLVAGGGWWWFEQRTDGRDRADRRETVAEVEAQLAATLAAAEKAEPTPEAQIRWLEESAGLQRRLASLRPERFTALLAEVRRTEQRIDALRTRVARQRSEAQEQAAHERLAAGDMEGGAGALREALQLQHDLNASAQGGRNFDRELRLQRELAELTAEPLLQAVAAKTGQARAAVAAAQWEQAHELFREARELQERLNREFPRTRYSDLAAIARLEAEIAALTADGLDAQVGAHLQRAREQRAAGETAEAVKEYAAAAAAQRQLNERFGQSRFVSMERLEAIEGERQTLLAAEPLRAAQEKRAAAQRFLRKRQIFQAQQNVRAGHELMADIAARFPRARARDDETRLVLAFLQLRSGDLAALQDRAYEQLAPLGAGARALLKTEVLQEDFAKLMNTNPSRNPGPARPVDSVTHGEAEEYCRRLGWVLGRRVRLPGVDDMRDALAAGGEFENVSGGLAEWLASPGGRENPEAGMWLGSGEAVTAPRTERVRTRGFRVVVEVDLARLGEE